MALDRLLVQATVDTKPNPAPTTVMSLQIGTESIEVQSTPNKQLKIIDTTGESVVCPIGESNAIVLQLDRVSNDFVVSARNAETLERIELVHHCVTRDGPSANNHGAESDGHRGAVLTVGGPSTALTGDIGRHRTGIVVIDVAPRLDPIDGLARAAKGARRFVGSVKRRIS